MPALFGAAANLICSAVGIRLGGWAVSKANDIALGRPAFGRRMAQKMQNNNG